jgi:hypothetical protein
MRQICSSERWVSVGDNLRAAAPAADPGRSGKEAKLAEKRFGALHLEVLDLFAMYIVVKYI